MNYLWTQLMSPSWFGLRLLCACKRGYWQMHRYLRVRVNSPDSPINNDGSMRRNRWQSEVPQRKTLTEEQTQHNFVAVSEETESDVANETKQVLNAPVVFPNRGHRESKSEEICVNVSIIVLVTNWYFGSATLVKRQLAFYYSKKWNDVFYTPHAF